MDDDAAQAGQTGAFLVLEFMVMGALAIVHPFHEGKVLDVPLLTNAQKTGRDQVRPPAFAIRFLASAQALLESGALQGLAPAAKMPRREADGGRELFDLFGLTILRWFWRPDQFAYS
jgi:hypothetical protein